MKYFEIEELYDITRQQMVELNVEYKDRIKGDAYQKRKFQLIDKLDSLKRKAKEIGTIGVICHVQGKRNRQHRKNPRLLVTERFNLYFVNITEKEASALIKLHVKNVVHYTIRFIRPGIIISTS